MIAPLVLNTQSLSFTDDVKLVASRHRWQHLQISLDAARAWPVSWNTPPEPGKLYASARENHLLSLAYGV